jgi:hypothetical protein
MKQQIENDKAQQKQQEISAKAYELFSKEKPVEVAIVLNLREPEVNRMYREYWKLKRLYDLDSLYEEIGDESIRDVVNLISFEHDLCSKYF